VDLLRRYSNLPDLDPTLRRARRRLREPTSEATSKVPPRRKLAQRLDPATVARLVTDYQAGASTAALMEPYDLGKGSVIQLLHEAGVPMRYQGLSPTEAEEAATLYATGLSIAKVAAKLDLPASSVYDALKRAGVAMRPAHGGA
jgi:uncharacterized protein (DUF433 family)